MSIIDPRPISNSFEYTDDVVDTAHPIQCRYGALIPRGFSGDWWTVAEDISVLLLAIV